MPVRMIMFFLLLLGGGCVGKPQPDKGNGSALKDLHKEKESQRRKVLLIPASLNEEYLCDTFKKYVWEIYGMISYTARPVKILDSLRSSTNSYYFSADKILKYLRRIKPDSVDHIMLITSKDIVSPHTMNLYGKETVVPDYGIFGLGQCPGVATTESTFRLQLKPVPKKLLSERFIKVCLHELGHNFGLPHCTATKHCLMRSAEGTIKTVDSETYKMCENCYAKLGLK